MGGKNRSETCIFSPSSAFIPETLLMHGGGQHHFSVPGCTFWSKSTTLPVDPGDENNVKSLEKERNFLFHLPRRHSHFSFQQEKTAKGFTDGFNHFGGSRSLCEQKEKHLGTYSGPSTFGFPFGFETRNLGSSRVKNTICSTATSKIKKQGSLYTQKNGCNFGQHQKFFAGLTPAKMFYRSNVNVHSSRKDTRLGSFTVNFPSVKTGNCQIDTANPGMERKEFGQKQLNSGNFIQIPQTLFGPG